jgi:hypothetical protein
MGKHLGSCRPAAEFATLHLVNTNPCRDCAQTVSIDAAFCPHCGAPKPALHEWNGEGYEWKSTATLGGWPVVHVAFGIDRAGKVRTARGIVAIGQRAVGVVACGILALGVVAFGVVCGGVISLGVVAGALFLACGVNAIAPIAFGVVAVGAMAGGVNAIGWKILFSAAR